MRHPLKLRSVLFILLLFLLNGCEPQLEQPNVIFVFGDQWRAEALGYAGNSQVKTPALDKFASEAVVFTNAVSTFPVCTPYRASLMTGQYPLTHRVIYNDKPLETDAISIADVYKEAGYHTAYIGKWHIDGNERSAFIPKERRQGFDYWKVLECTHDYNNSWYWDNDDQKKKWEGYDAIAQTNDAIGYLKQHDGEDPSSSFFPGALLMVLIIRLLKSTGTSMPIRRRYCCCQMSLPKKRRWQERPLPVTMRISLLLTTVLLP